MWYRDGHSEYSGLGFTYNKLVILLLIDNFLYSSPYPPFHKNLQPIFSNVDVMKNLYIIIVIIIYFHEDLERESKREVYYYYIILP